MTADDQSSESAARADGDPDGTDLTHKGGHIRSSEFAKPARWTVPGTNVGWEEIGILVVAIILFFIGAIFSQENMAPDSYPRLVQACVEKMPAAGDCVAVINGIHESTHTFLHFNWLEALAEAMKALAVAIAVTVGVASILDARRGDRLSAELTTKAQQIGISVFDSLFGNNHGADLLEKLKRDILYKPVVRESLSMMYELQTYQGRGRLRGQTFTTVKAQVTSEFKNISTVSGSVSRTPLQLSLPNPLVNELKKLTSLDYVKIVRNKGEPQVYSNTDLLAANQLLQTNLADDLALEGLVTFGELELDAGDTGSLEIHYTMMKEAEDSEFLRSFHTTSSLSLAIADSTKRDLVVRAKAIHSSSLKSLPGTKTFLSWTLKEIVLPQQGVLIWWKERPTSRVQPRTRRLAKTAPTTVSVDVN